MIPAVKEFLKLESAGGFMLLAASGLALLFANSPWASHYDTWMRPLAFPINDGLMVLFFLLIGLEIKQEWHEGSLARPANALLPVIAAIGGVIAPALIFRLFNADSYAVRGWAIPCATDIAFSLAILSLLGNRLPPALRMFLMTVAVIDDIIAIIIIAVFYTNHLAFIPFIMAAGCLIILWGLNRCVSHLWPYILTGLLLWLSILASGVHPTIAGIMFGLTLPQPLIGRVMHMLHPWVAFGIMPVFAFANAGIALGMIDMTQLLHPVTTGIAIGLFIGKPFGIFVASYLVIRLTRATLPAQSGWLEFYAVCMLAGIGFTMSLFIGSLAFSFSTLEIPARLGIIIGSLFSAVFGYSLLSFALRFKRS